MFGSDRVLALDVGSSKIVLAEFKLIKGGGLELLNYGIEQLGFDPDTTPDPAAFIVSGIRDALRSSGIRPGPVALSISGQMVFPRYVKLPPVTSDKISQIVRYEAQQNVPFPIDEVVWDYQLVGQDSGELSVMLVAVKGEAVKNITDCVEAAGLDPVLVDVSPLALYNTVRFNYFDAEGCTMILDMGARSTNVIFMEGARIFSRSIPVAGIAITKDVMKEFELSFEEAEQMKAAHAFVGFGGAYEGHEVGVADRTSKIVRNVMTRLHAEVSRTINFYRSQQGGGQPTQVLLAGGCSVIPHLGTFLKEKLKMDVDALNPFKNVAVNPAIEGDRIAGQVHLMGEVVGLGLRRALTCPVEINLMPPELVARHVFQRRIPFLAMAAAGLILLMLVFWVFLDRMRGMAGLRAEKVHARVEALTPHLNSLQGLAKQQAVVAGKLADLGTLVQGRTRWMDILNGLHSLMPDGMWITSLDEFPVTDRPDESTLVIQGVGFSDKVTHQTITDFAGKLKGIGYFSDNVQIKKIRPVAGTDYLNEFVIDIRLSGKPSVLAASKQEKGSAGN